MSLSPAPSLTFLPPDVAAYLAEAAAALGEEQGFVPADETQTGAWMLEHFGVIVERARELMLTRMWGLILKPERLAVAAGHLGAKVYDRIREANPNPPREWNENYAAYAREHGYDDPADMLAHDKAQGGAIMANFQSWLRRRAADQSAAT